MIEIVIIIYIIGIGILFYEQSLHGDVDVVDILMWPVIAVFVFFGVMLPDWFENMLEKIREVFRG